MKTPMTHLMCCLALGSAALLFSHPVKAQTSQQDKDFLKTASQANVDEIKMAELAEKKAADPDVRGFARLMVKDHTTLGGKVAPFASDWGLTAPTTMDADHQEEWNKLDKMHGKEFDKRFIDDMVKDHEQAYDLFHKEVLDTQDMKFKPVIEEGQSMVVAHLNMAKSLQGKL
jgi:putative membrane protein